MPINPDEVQWDTTPAPEAQVAQAAPGAIDPGAVQWDNAAPAALAAPAKKRTMTEEVMRQLGLTGRAAITGLTGMTGAIADTLNSANNLGRGVARAGDLTTTPNTPAPSEGIQNALTQAGFPQPAGMQENIVQAGASMLAGAGDPVTKALQAGVNAKYAAPDKAKMVDVRAQTLKEAGDAGYAIPPSQAEAGFATRTLEGLGGSSRTIEMAKAKNQMVTDALSRKALNLPEGTPLTPETLSNVSKSAYQSGYAPIAEAGKMTTGRVYRESLNKLVDDLQGQARSFPEAAKNEVLDLVKSYRVKEFDAGDAIKAARQLRMDARASFKQDNNAMGLAQRGIADALEKNIEVNLNAMGQKGAEMLANFRTSRALMSKAHVVEDALIEGAGSVNALKVAAQMRNGMPLTNELKTIAKTADTFGRSVAYPASGKPAPLNVGDNLLMVSGGLGAQYGLGPLIGLPALRYGMREAALAGPIQRALVHGTGQPAAPGIMANPAVQRMIPGMYPLFNPGQEAQLPFPAQLPAPQRPNYADMIPR